MKSVSRKFIALVLAAVMMLSFGVMSFAGSKAVFTVDPFEDGSYAVSGIKEGSADDGILTIPAKYNENGKTYDITAIGDDALAYYDGISPEFLKDVTAVVVEKGVKSIGENAFFAFPALTKVTFKGDVEIGRYAFQDCAKLKTVVFEGSAKLDNYAFADCGALTEIKTAKDKVYDCAKNALEDTAWYKNYTVDFVTLGTTLIEYKGHDAVETIPLNVTAIGTSAFEGNTTLEKIILSQYVDTLGDRAFAGCTALKEVVFTPYCEIKSMGVDVFKNTPYFDDFQGEFFIIGNTLVKYMRNDVEFVKIPNTVTAIAPDSLEGCYISYSDDTPESFVISAIYVPASVTDLGKDCFVLAKFSDKESYSPRIYAFEGTPAYEALKDAGYLVTAMGYKKGDLNKDGKITAADARIALRLSVNLEEGNEFINYAADIDGDNVVTSADARILLRIAVGLENYSIDDLMNIPTSKIEILGTYQKALKEAAKAKLGYTKAVKSSLVSSDINKAHANKIESLAMSKSENQTYIYKKNNQAAVDGLPVVSLQDTSLIRSSRCTAKGGKYYITIKLYDVLDDCVTSDAPEYNGGRPYIDMMMPVVSGKVFYNAFSSNKWWKLVPDSNTIAPNCVRKYSLIFADPTITAVIDVATGLPESIVLSLGYNFAVDGRINGLDISSAGYKTGDAIVNRLDTVTYTNFN